jgi:hypothetical protein
MNAETYKSEYYKQFSPAVSNFPPSCMRTLFPRTLIYTSFFKSIRQIHEQSYMIYEYKDSTLDFAPDRRLFTFCERPWEWQQRMRDPWWAVQHLETRETRNASVRISGVPAEILTEDFLSTSPGPYRQVNPYRKFIKTFGLPKCVVFAYLVRRNLPQLVAGQSYVPTWAQDSSIQNESRDTTDRELPSLGIRTVIVRCCGGAYLTRGRLCPLEEVSAIVKHLRITTAQFWKSGNT